MCKEDIRIARKKKFVTSKTAVLTGTTVGIGQARADRTALAVAADISWSYNLAIGGSFNTGTGAVAETFNMSIPLGVRVGFNDGTSLIAVAILSREQPSVLLRLEDLGPVIFGQLTVSNDVGFAVFVHVTDIYLGESLENV